ncbi:hypothetical protein ALO75_102475 [Pseudomonas syringae pv. coryli]|uniref:Uncharacterized protein n=2 Tax=Pseudomonas syringae group TaxID=136849 RepID=A0AB74AA56_PSESX|nr:hypothetical protein ALO75_102475 [Pseudomonas syringae pv. coryli]KPX60310.1 hypothetical protein ALO39_101850 [Pseudomonas syringae pv. lapsa]RML15260.1 hypothetical protein ALQ99_101727 [Pseudomonas syringae pv. lapsa]RML27809.1 hypothetical protein ALQ98_101511 [Pseudomonas syringae pv. lapsa]
MTLVTDSTVLLQVRAASAVNETARRCQVWGAHRLGTLPCAP